MIRVIKHSIKSLLILLAVVCFHITGWTQGKVFTGQVISETAEPIMDVNVLNTRTGEHAHSMDDGSFVLQNTRLADTLLFSHIGFYTYKYIVEAEQSRVGIRLKSQMIDLSEITISPSLDALKLMSNIDLQVDPVSSSQEILTKVPGLFIGQHAGGGKAEQIFLRGFDIDHGTDIAISVDGLPVNMVSHAHGQGYADLHFVIPETIDRIDFGIGGYYADQGNFNTAGYVNFELKERLRENRIQLEAGSFNTQRILLMQNVIQNTKHSAYIASEYLQSDGPFDSPQNFSRFNGMARYTGKLSDKDKLTVTASHFTSEWDASGQIPVRAVESGLIGRFGAIDDTEGGTTGRTNVLVSHRKLISNTSSITNTLFYSRYNFELYSNFTFFLDNPQIGDQIRQKENRNLFGIKSEFIESLKIGKANAIAKLGVQLRRDYSNDNELSKTANRDETIEFIQLGNIKETNAALYADLNLEYGKWVFNPSLRFDLFNYNYENQLSTTYDEKSLSRSILNPKFNVLYNQNPTMQYFLKLGRGFHSNDTRVSVQDPDIEVLPAAYTADLGFLWKPTSRMLFSTAAWYLFLDQEFVYVGDAGIVEPSGQTRRYGLEANLRYEPIKRLFINADANYTIARAVNEELDQQYIPLAADFTSRLGIQYHSEKGFYGGLDVRHLGDRPANEDYSITAEGYTIVDVNAGYDIGKIGLGIQIQNLLNSEWNETQFATESRLQDEVESVEEIHFTPGTPFNIKGIASYRF